jgi:hypothetical protein
MNNLKRLRLHALLVVGAFLTSIVVAGHGMGPIGLLLVLGWEAWLLPVLTGWATLIVLTIGCLSTGTRSRGLIAVGAVLTIVAWLACVRQADAVAETIRWSSHYLIAVVTFLVRLAVAREGRST